MHSGSNSSLLPSPCPRCPDPSPSRASIRRPDAHVPIGVCCGTLPEPRWRPESRWRDGGPNSTGLVGSRGSVSGATGTPRSRWFPAALERAAGVCTVFHAQKLDQLLMYYDGTTLSELATHGDFRVAARQKVGSGSCLRGLHGLHRTAHVQWMPAK